MLSEVTPGISATARCTRRRSYAFSGPMLCSTPEFFAFSARNFAIAFSSLSLSRRKLMQSMSSRLCSPSCRRNALSTMCCSA